MGFWAQVAKELTKVPQNICAANLKFNMAKTPARLAACFRASNASGMVHAARIFVHFCILLYICAFVVSVRFGVVAKFQLQLQPERWPPAVHFAAFACVLPTRSRRSAPCIT
jgi:hypothetical protein